MTSALLRWFQENGRELPWRGTKDPYAVWLSEIILQQTQVRQGWDYWERFMRRWPTVEALAAATEDEVLCEWQGLGYYSRARNLHTAAKQVVERGGFPNTVEGLRQLKGVGDYTAAAIGSIAFGLPAAVVDGNVYRVLSRHFGIATPINTTKGKKEFAALAQSLAPSHLPQLGEDFETSLDEETSPSWGSMVGAYNQAIMDFGAIQCTPTSPKCGQCPLQESCVAYREGRIAELPVKLRTLKVKERRLTYVYIRCQGMTAIHRRGVGDIWQGLYEPWLTAEPVQGAVLLRRNVKHVLTHRVIYADFYLLETDERPTLPHDYIWVKEENLGDYGVPRLIEKMFNEINRKR
jgi:A/G-specific adenine glycosylase